MRKLAEAIIEYLDNTADEFGLVVRVKNSHWKHDLPRKFEYIPNILLVFKGWTKEESSFTKDGVFVRTAFDYEDGETRENEALIPWGDILALTDDKGKPVIQFHNFAEYVDKGEEDFMERFRKKVEMMKKQTNPDGDRA